MNVPDLGCLPVMRIMNTEKNGSCLEKATSLAKLHNEALSKQLFDLQKQLKGFKYSLFDLNSSLRKRINHPFKYGMSLHFHLFILCYFISNLFLVVVAWLKYSQYLMWSPAFIYFTQKNLKCFVTNLPSFRFFNLQLIIYYLQYMKIWVVNNMYKIVSII